MDALAVLGTAIHHLGEVDKLWGIEARPSELAPGKVARRVNAVHFLLLWGRAKFWLPMADITKASSCYSESDEKMKIVC